MKVLITQVPKQKQAVAPISPFTNPYTPEMAYGGALQGRGSQNGVPLQVLDTKWDWMRMGDKKSGYDPGPYSSVGRTLPEATDGGDINAEKKEQVMGDFNGDGMPVLMNVDGPPHTEGGKDVSVPENSFVFSDTKSLQIKDPAILKQFGVSKPITPAQIAAKYDLQKYKAVIDNDEADDLDKKTAQLMYTNFTNKLNSLASVQESMKQGNEQKKQMKLGGSVPQYQQGGHPTFDDWGNSYANQLPQQNVSDSRIPGYGFQGANPPTQMNTVIPPGQDLGTYNVPEMPAMNYDLPSGTNNGNNTTARKQLPDNLPTGITPDQMRDFMLGLRSLSYPKYSPVRQISHAVTPQTVFMDPTRAKAAITEGANSAGYLASISGNGPTARANALAASGTAGAQAANVEGQYSNENARIANQANSQAADIYNKTWQQQQSYNKEYNEEVANQLKDRYGFTTSMANEYLKGKYEDRARATSAHNYNYINPYYSFDEQGFLHPKSKEQSEGLLKQLNVNGYGKSQGADAQTWAAIIKQAKDAGLNDNQAELYLKHMMNERERINYDARGMLKGSTESGSEDELGRPSFVRKIGGIVKKKTKMKIISTP